MDAMVMVMLLLIDSTYSAQTNPETLSPTPPKTHRQQLLNPNPPKLYTPSLTLDPERLNPKPY